MMSSSSSEDKQFSPPSPTDAELFRELKSGRSVALVALYDRYGKVVYGLALKLLRHPQEAEDLTQEVFLELWRKSTYDPDRSSLIQYLVVVTRSRAIDRLRSRSRGLKLLQRWQQMGMPVVSASSSFEEITAIEQSEWVRDALARLPQKQRRVLELAYDDGLSQSEIAQRLAMPLGTVKTQTRQGLLKLKAILQETTRQ